MSSSTWPYGDSPLDMLQDCMDYHRHLPQATYSKCATATALGVWSAYLLPIICTLDIACSILCITSFGLMKEKHGQAVYMLSMCVCGMLTDVLFGWLWLFPAKGLPFATQGRVFYFIFYASDAVCRVHRFAYSFTVSASNNLLLVATADRCLMLLFPVKFLGFPKRYAIYVTAATLGITFIMMVPCLYFFHWVNVNGKLMCGIPNKYFAFDVYHTLVSNAGIVQPIMIGILNIVFIYQIHRLRKRSKSNEEQEEANAQAFWRYSVVLVTMSTTYIFSALLQGCAYIAAYALTASSNKVGSDVRLAYNIADLGWHIYFLRQLINECLIMKYFTPVAKYLKQMLTRIHH